MIEINKSPIVKEMHLHIESFWSELIKFIRAKDIASVYKILGGLGEPKETHLGYAQCNASGNSVSRKIKPKLVEAIQKNKAVQTGILSHFSDVELFIEDISSDRISDITTKIIKKVLIDYTIQQCLMHDVKTFDFKQSDVFNPMTKSWDIISVKLPEFDGKPIILIPKSIVRLENSANKNMSSLYRFAIRHFIANDQEMIEDISPTGKDGQLLLRDVKSEYPLSKTSMSNWMLKYGRLLVDYKSDILKERIRPLTDDEISDIIYPVDISKAS